MLYSYHRGQYMQRGRGIGGIFASLFRWLKPIIPKILSVGKKAVKDPEIGKALNSVKSQAVSAGERVINKGLRSIAPDKPPPNKKAKTSPPPPRPRAPKPKAKFKSKPFKKKNNKQAATIFDNMIK